MPGVIRKNGRLIIRVENGDTTEDILPAAYLSYCPADADYDGFYAAGYRLFSYCVYLGDCPINEENGTLCSFEPGVWCAPDRFDFSPLDRGMERIMGQDYARRVYVILRINLNMPVWWRETYPEELIHLRERRLMQSVASLRWRRDAGYALEKLKEHTEAAPYARAIIGWQVAAMHTEEWFQPASVASSLVRDEPLLAVFRRWCAAIYPTADAIRQARGRTVSCPEDIRLPTGEEILERQSLASMARSYRFVRDYADCLNHLYADTICYFTRKVKALFDGRILCGAFYGYIGQLGDLSGHCAVKKLMAEPSIDFFASPFAYNDARGLGVDWIHHAPMESMDRAGKLWFVEADVRTDRTRPLADTRPDVCPPTLPYFRQAVFFGPKTRAETIHLLVRAFGKCLAFRNGFWWFDMWGGWYRDADLLTLLGKLRTLYEASVETEAVTSVSEIAVVLDGRASSWMPSSIFHTSVTRQLAELGFLGAPYDLLLLDHVTEADAHRYKLFFLLAPDTSSSAYARCRSALAHTAGSVLVTGMGEAADTPIFYGKTLVESVEAAGVHLYAPRQIVYANSHYLVLTATCDGTVPLRLPEGCRASDALGGTLPEPCDGVYHLPMKMNECRLLHLSRAKPIS